MALLNSNIPTGNNRAGNEYKRLSTELGNTNLDAARRARINQRFSYKGWTIPKATNPVVTTQPVGSTIPVTEGTLGMGKGTPAPAAPTQTQDPNAAINQNTNSLFPGYGTFTQADAEASPLYKYRLNTGQDSLKAYYASKGLTNSGAEDAGNAKLIAQLSAEETDRAQQAAQSEADRMYNMQQSEVGRQERAGQTQWSRVMDMLNYSQANSPMPYATQMASTATGLETSKNNALAKYLADMYKRVQGGGGGGMMPYMAPKSGSPDFSTVDILAAMNKGGSNRGYLNMGTDFLAGLMNAYGG